LRARRRRALTPTLLLLLPLLALALTLALAPDPSTAADKRRSAREWASTLTAGKLRQLEHEEWRAMDELSGNPKMQPDMVFAHLKEGLPKLEEQRLAGTWHALLHGVGVPVQIFDGGSPSTWVVTVNRAEQARTVMDFLVEQPEVMRAVFKTTERWNLPRYQTEYESHARREAASRATREKEL